MEKRKISIKNHAHHFLSVPFNLWKMWKIFNIEKKINFYFEMKIPFRPIIIFFYFGAFSTSPSTLFRAKTSTFFVRMFLLNLGDFVYLIFLDNNGVIFNGFSGAFPFILFGTILGKFKTINKALLEGFDRDLKI